MNVLYSPSEAAGNIAKALGLPDGVKSFTLTAPEKGPWIIEAVILVNEEAGLPILTEKKYTLTEIN